MPASSFRLLRRGSERHHRVRSLLPSRQRLWGLHVHHGEPLLVSYVPYSLLCEVHVWIGSTQSEHLYCTVWYLLSYVVSSLELLVAEDYMIVYLNGATPRRKMPGISWLKRCYQMIDRKWVWATGMEIRIKTRNLKLKLSMLKINDDTNIMRRRKASRLDIFSRRLRKNLKCLLIAHPTWFIRTILAVSRPFIRWEHIQCGLESISPSVEPHTGSSFIKSKKQTAERLQNCDTMIHIITEQIIMRAVLQGLVLMTERWFTCSEWIFCDGYCMSLMCSAAWSSWIRSVTFTPWRSSARSSPWSMCRSLSVCCSKYSEHQGSLWRH